MRTGLENPVSAGALPTLQPFASLGHSARSTSAGLVPAAERAGNTANPLASRAATGTSSTSVQKGTRGTPRIPSWFAYKFHNERPAITPATSPMASDTTMNVLDCHVL